MQRTDFVFFGVDGYAKIGRCEMRSFAVSGTRDGSKEEREALTTAREVMQERRNTRDVQKPRSGALPKDPRESWHAAFASG